MKEPATYRNSGDIYTKQDKERQDRMETSDAIPDNGVVIQRKKMVNIALQFACDADDEAMTVKAEVNAIVAKHPAIQVAFSIIERPIPTA